MRTVASRVKTLIQGGGAKNVSSIIEVLAKELFFVELPTHERLCGPRGQRQKATLTRVPQKSNTAELDDELGVICDAKGAALMAHNANAAVARGGHAVLDNLTSVTSDGATSRGGTYQAEVVKHTEGGSYIAGLSTADAGESSAAKGASLSATYGNLRQAACALRLGGLLNARDVNSISLLNASVLNTDRCAAEQGQRSFIVKAKEKLLPERLGQEFLEAELAFSLRLAPAGVSSVRVETRCWLIEGASEAAEDLAASGLESALTDAVNAMLRSRPAAADWRGWLAVKLTSGEASSSPPGAGGGQLSMDADRYLRDCGVQAALEYAVNVVGLNMGVQSNPIGACASMLSMVRDYDAHFLTSAASMRSGDGGIPGKLRLSGGGWVTWTPSDAARASWAFRLGRSGVAPAAHCSPEHVLHVQETQFDDDARIFTVSKALNKDGDAWPSHMQFSWRLADSPYVRVRGLVRSMHAAGGCVELPEEEEEAEEEQQSASSEEESEAEPEESARRKRQRAGQRKYNKAQRQKRGVAERARAAEARRAEAHRARAQVTPTLILSGPHRDRARIGPA